MMKTEWKKTEFVLLGALRRGTDQFIVFAADCVGGQGCASIHTTIVGMRRRTRSTPAQ